MTGRGDSAGRGNVRLAVVALIAGAAVFVVGLAQGAPQPLPGVALGWPLLLYLERAGFVALLITGLGGITYRLLTGGQVKGTGGGPLPGVDVEDATKPTEALKEGVDADVKDLNDHLLDVEKRVERLESHDLRPD